MKCLPQKELGENLGHPYNGITSPFVLGGGEVSGVERCLQSTVER